jgi:hypothetical protein
MSAAAREVRQVSARLCALVLLALLSVQTLAKADAVLLSDMPAYDWYHGCGPTSVGMIMGYWDLHGYSNLFKASGQDLFLTVNVQDEISSPAHNAKYDSTPDDPNLPVPTYTSIADWCQTSVDPSQYGSSQVWKTTLAFSHYAQYKGYLFTARNWDQSYFTWQRLTAEIDAGRPMLFTVDSNGDGSVDHFVPVFGYEDRGVNGLWYACYTTWSEDETPAWYQYQAPPLPGDPVFKFGVGYIATVVPAPIPEPTTLLTLSLGMTVMLRRNRNRKPTF